MSLLALVLFSPWFAILGWAYWTFPRTLPHTPARRAGDLVALTIAVIGSARAMHLAYAANVGFGGAIWKQVIATLCGYGVFLAVLGMAFVLRSLWWAPRT